MNDTRTVFLIGKPGCGKGTQAKFLAKKTGWQVITAGDQFRALAAEDTPVGHKTKMEIDAGLLVPHWFAMYLFLKALFSVEGGKSVIFDGFSRKVPEAELIIDSLHWLNRPFTMLHLAVSDDEVRKRLALRKSVEGRVDDNAIEERLREYHAYTEPAILKFNDAGKLIEINGEQTPEAIAADIDKALEI